MATAKKITPDPVSLSGMPLYPSDCDESSSLHAEGAYGDVPEYSSLDLSDDDDSIGSDGEPGEPAEPWDVRLARIDAAVPKPVVRKDPVDYLLDWVLIAVQLLVLTQVYSPDTWDPAPGDSDASVYKKLLYVRLLEMYRRCRPALGTIAKLRADMFERDIGVHVGPRPHPTYTIVDASKRFSYFSVTRKIKRAASANPRNVAATQGVYFNAWTGERRNVRELQHTREPVVDERNRPVLGDDGKVVTVRLEGAIEGDDPRRDKRIMFVPRPSDVDPDAPDTYADMDSHERMHQMVGEIQGNLPALGQGLPAPFQFYVPASLVVHVAALHNVIHYERHLEQAVLEHVQGTVQDSLPYDWPALWLALVGEKNAAAPTIERYTKRGKFAEIIVTFREMLRTNVSMLQCDACAQLGMVECTTCPQCARTVRSCPRRLDNTPEKKKKNRDCRDEALAQHTRQYHTEKKTPKKRAKGATKKAPATKK